MMERYSGNNNIDSTEDQESIHKHPLWMIIYTDMITNLMIFFLLSYCLTWLSTEDREIAAKSFQEAYTSRRVAPEVKEEDKLILGLTDEKKAEDELKSKFTNIEITEEMIKITLPSPVLFDSGKAELKPAAMTALKDIANTIKNMSNRLLIEGHTDNKPVHSKKFQSNWELSTARAFSVIRYFIENEKLDPRRLSAVGYGEFRPKDSNETEEGRAVNRRIEIYIAKLK